MLPPGSDTTLDQVGLGEGVGDEASDGNSCTVEPRSTWVPPFGSCAATMLGSGHCRLSWGPPMLELRWRAARSAWAWESVSQTTSGTMAFAGPSDTVTFTADPLSTFVSGVGSCAKIVSVGVVLFCCVPVP